TTRSASGSGAKAGRVVLGLHAAMVSASAMVHFDATRFDVVAWTTRLRRISVCEAAFPVGACAARPPSTYRWEQRRVHHARALPPPSAGGPASLSSCSPSRAAAES